MSEARLLYSSENGDRWLLVREEDPARVYVRHEPNAPSGGRTSEIEIGEFLIRGIYGPEHLALLRLIGTLVDDHARQDRMPDHPIGPDEATTPIAFI
jgi:hypothetical protein